MTMLPLMLLFASKFALPPDAKVTVGPRVYIGKSPELEKSACLSGGMGVATVAGMRLRFARFHELREREYHDWYAWYGCEVRGTVDVGGRKFRWTYEFGNTMWTDYPDGQMRQLGGKHTDDPSGGEAQ